MTKEPFDRSPEQLHDFVLQISNKHCKDEATYYPWSPSDGNDYDDDDDNNNDDDDDVDYVIKILRMFLHTN